MKKILIRERLVQTRGYRRARTHCSRVKTVLTLLSLVLTVQAQETYTNADFIGDDLNGTARYVGMGGAMEALGADISTMGTNPAGIGLFRRSTVSVTGGIITQQNEGTHPQGDKTNVSFDQAGFVWSTNLGSGKYLNIGFNYKKNRNYDFMMSVADNLDGSSQNKNSYMNLMDAYSASGDNFLYDYNVSQLDALYYNTFVGDNDGNMYYNNGTRYTHDMAVKGSLNEYDINISGNVSNRVYLGITFGFHDVNYKSYSTYTEYLVNSSDESIGSITVDDYRRISGTGFNIKAGAIFFPIEDSPFRIGLSISTPTWYDLEARSYTTLSNDADTGSDPIDPSYAAEGYYEYRVYTPWKFGVSLGHTIGSDIALGASYEYADYSSTSNRIIDGYDYYGQENTFKDEAMNNHSQRTLRGVSTFKVGAEMKVLPELAVRLGYDYVSSMYRDEGYRDGTVSSLGTYYSSRSDYTNWKSTNRITCGVGYSSGHFGIDLAYQYSVTNGEYHPFMDSSAAYTFSDGTAESVSNYANAVDVNNKRHQVIATLSYRF